MLSLITVNVVGIFTSIIIARNLTPECYGLYNVFQIYISILLVLSSFGLRNVIVKNIARDKSNSKVILRNSVSIRTFCIIITLILFLVFSIFIKKYDILFIVLVSSGLVVGSFYEIIESIIYGFEKMGITAILNIIIALISLLILSFLPKGLINVENLLILNLVLQALKLLLLLPNARKNIISYKFVLNQHDKFNIKEIIIEAYPFYIISLLTLFSNQLPVLFLESRSGLADVGYFNLSNKLLSPLNYILINLYTVLFPVFSRLFVVDSEKFILKMNSLIYLLLIVGVVGSIGVSLFKNEIIIFLYGEKYLNTSQILLNQVWYITIYSIVCFIGMILSSIDKQKLLSVLSIILTIVQMGSLWFLSQYGVGVFSLGYLWVTIFSMLIHFFSLKIVFRDKFKYRDLIFIQIVSIVFLIISYKIPNDLNIYLKFIILGFFSIIGLFVIKHIYQKLKMN